MKVSKVLEASAEEDLPWAEGGLETVGDQLGEFETQDDIEDAVEPEHYGKRDAEPITGSIPAAAGHSSYRPHYGKRDAEAGHHGYGYGHYKPHYGSHGHSYTKPHHGSYGYVHGYKKPHTSGYGHHYGKRDAVAASAKKEKPY